MISTEKAKIILDRPDLSDKEIEQVRDWIRSLAEVIFETWEFNKDGNEDESKQNKTNTRDCE